MVLKVGAPAVVPLRIGQPGRERRARRRLRRQVELHPEPARGAAVGPAERQLVHVLRRLAGRLGIVLVVIRPGDVDGLGRQQEHLALVDQGQRVGTLGGVEPAAPGAPTLPLLVPALALAGLRVGARRGAGRRIRAHLAPERARQERPVGGRRAQPVQRRGRGDEPRDRAVAAGLAVQRPHRPLDLGLDAAEAAARAERQERTGQPAVALPQARKGREDPPRRQRRRAQEGDVAPERVAAGLPRGGRQGQEGGEPDVKLAVEPGLRQAVEGRREQDELGRALGREQPLLAHAEPLDEAQAVPARPRRAGRQLEPRIAAHGAEQDREPAPLGLERYRGRREARPARPVADDPVPEAAELLLDLQDLERQGRPPARRPSRSSRARARAGRPSRRRRRRAARSRRARRPSPGRTRPGPGSRRRRGAGSRPPPRCPPP